MTQDDRAFHTALAALAAGDFALDALFQDRGADGRRYSQIEAWYHAGRFEGHPAALAQAFTCACLLGHTRVAAFLLDHGVDPTQGAEAGQTGFHNAVLAGHLETVELLIERKAPLEVLNRFGGTVLGQALWSAINEPKADHGRIIDRLIAAGADLQAVGGRDVVDRVLRHHRAMF